MEQLIFNNNNNNIVLYPPPLNTRMRSTTIVWEKFKESYYCSCYYFRKSSGWSSRLDINWSASILVFQRLIKFCVYIQHCCWFGWWSKRSILIVLARNKRKHAPTCWSLVHQLSLQFTWNLARLLFLARSWFQNSISSFASLIWIYLPLVQVGVVVRVAPSVKTRQWYRLFMATAGSMKMQQAILLVVVVRILSIAAV